MNTWLSSFWSRPINTEAEAQKQVQARLDRFIKEKQADLVVPREVLSSISYTTFCGDIQEKQKCISKYRFRISRHPHSVSLKTRQAIQEIAGSQVFDFNKMKSASLDEVNMRRYLTPYSQFFTVDLIDEIEDEALKTQFYLLLKRQLRPLIEEASLCKAALDRLPDQPIGAHLIENSKNLTSQEKQALLNQIENTLIRDYSLDIDRSRVEIYFDKNPLILNKETPSIIRSKKTYEALYSKTKNKIKSIDLFSCLPQRFEASFLIDGKLQDRFKKVGELPHLNKEIEIEFTLGTDHEDPKHSLRTVRIQKNGVISIDYTQSFALHYWISNKKIRRFELSIEAKKRIRLNIQFRFKETEVAGPVQIINNESTKT